MIRLAFAMVLAFLCSLFSFARPGIVAAAAPSADELHRNFVSPPRQAQPWAFWWWLKGSISKEGITRDLEEFKRQGINGVVLFSSGGQAGPMPLGPVFMSPEWKAFLRHALHEADRLGIRVGINLCDGWDCGGPWITKDQANKRLVYSEVQVDGPRSRGRRSLCRCRRSGTSITATWRWWPTAKSPTPRSARRK